MDAAEIRDLLTDLGDRLHRNGLKGEMLVLGGTAMALVFNKTRRTKDIDAIFEPKMRIYEMAEQIAREKGLSKGWLNDAAKGFIAKAPEGTRIVLDHPGLIVRAPSPEYLFAMKALAGRDIDIEDIETLINILGLRTFGEALDVVERYYPRDQIPGKVQFILEEIFGR